MKDALCMYRFITVENLNTRNDVHKQEQLNNVFSLKRINNEEEVLADSES